MRKRAPASSKQNLSIDTADRTKPDVALSWVSLRTVMKYGLSLQHYALMCIIVNMMRSGKLRRTYDERGRVFFYIKIDHLASFMEEYGVSYRRVLELVNELCGRTRTTAKYPENMVFEKIVKRDTFRALVYLRPSENFEEFLYHKITEAERENPEILGKRSIAYFFLTLDNAEQSEEVKTAASGYVAEAGRTDKQGFTDDSVSSRGESVAAVLSPPPVRNLLPQTRRIIERVMGLPECPFQQHRIYPQGVKQTKTILSIENALLDIYAGTFLKTRPLSLDYDNSYNEEFLRDLRGKWDAIEDAVIEAVKAFGDWKRARGGASTSFLSFFYNPETKKSLFMFYISGKSANAVASVQRTRTRLDPISLKAAEATLAEHPDWNHVLFYNGWYTVFKYLSDNWTAIKEANVTLAQREDRKLVWSYPTVASVMRLYGEYLCTYAPEYGGRKTSVKQVPYGKMYWKGFLEAVYSEFGLDFEPDPSVMRRLRPKNSK